MTIKQALYTAFTLLITCACTDNGKYPDAPTGELILKVQTNDFKPSAETRNPVEEGYKTVFKGGEQIGITAVKNGAVYNGMDNVPFTYDATTATWKPTDSSAPPQLYYYPGVTYIAYYPYATSMDGKKTEQEIIGNFTPQTDQSTYENYTASDLMTATGTVSGSNGAYTIAFNLQHRMSLLVVQSEGQRYITTNDYEYSSLPLNFKLKLNESSLLTPYESGIGTNTIIIPPATTTQKINISFNINGNTNVSREIIYNTLAAGTYYSIAFKNGGTKAETRDLQVGDYFYTDGSIVPQDVTTPPYAKSCIGIVYKIGTGKDDSVSDYGGKLTEIHGYVLSVYLAINNVSYGPYEDAGTSTSTDDYRGYFNTGKMIEAAATHGGLADNQNGYQAAYNATITCEKSYPSPENTSGWYLPSIGQLQDAFTMRNKIEENLGKVVGVSRSLSIIIRSNSEYEPDKRYAWVLEHGFATNSYGKDASWYHAYSSLTF